MTRSKFTRESFDSDAWVAALDRCVNASGITWKQVSEETGVHPSTLSRINTGQTMPDAVALAVLSAWAGINPVKYCREVAA